MKHDVLETIYMKYYRDVYLYAFSLCKNSVTAEDLTSETFYKALFSLNDEVLGIKYWLIRVCKNLFIDHCRRNKRYILDDYSTRDDLDPKSQENEALNKLIKNEEHQKLYQCILKLPARYSELIYMFYFSDLSITEIAGITGQTNGSIKTALSRARTKLKQMIREGQM